MTKRQPDWDLDSVRGRMGEDTAEILRESAVMGRAEVKADRVALDTGRLYVETACRAQDGRWWPSGINSTKADSYWFVPAPGAFALVFEIDALRWLVERNGAHSQLNAQCPNGTNPTRGVLIPWATLLRDLDAYGGGWR